MLDAPDPDPRDPAHIALSLSPTDRTALRWVPQTGEYKERTSERTPNSQSLWQLCNWRIMDGTPAPLVEPRDAGDQPFSGRGGFRATALGLRVREVITRPGPSPFARYTLASHKSMKRK